MTSAKEEMVGSRGRTSTINLGGDTICSWCDGCTVGLLLQLYFVVCSAGLGYGSSQHMWVAPLGVGDDSLTQD